MQNLKTQPNLIRQIHHKFWPNIRHEHRTQSKDNSRPNEQSFSHIRCDLHIKLVLAANAALPILSLANLSNHQTHPAR